MQLSQTISGILLKALIILSASHSFAGTVGAQINLWKDNSVLYEATATLLVTGKFYDSISLNAARSTEPSDKDFIYFESAAKSNKLLVSLCDQISDDLDKEIRKLLPRPTPL